MAGDKIICHCKQVSYIDIRKAMIAGARTVQEIKDMTAAKIHVAHNKNTTISTLLRRTNSPQYD